MRSRRNRSRLRESAGQRYEIIAARDLRPGDLLADGDPRRGIVGWRPVAAFRCGGRGVVQIGVDVGARSGPYAWSTMRSRKPVAIARRRLYLATVVLEGTTTVLDQSTQRDAIAAAAWLRTQLQRAPQRLEHVLGGYASPGQWITLDYPTSGASEFAYDEDAPADEYVVFTASVGGVLQTNGPTP